jgi:hypothetical protein
MPDRKSNLFLEAICGLIFVAAIILLPAVLTGSFGDSAFFRNASVITDFITLLAGLGGAVLGSLVTGRVWESHARNAKREKQKAELFKVVIKTSLIQSDFVNLKREIDESIKNANANGLVEMPNWTKVQSDPGNFEQISVSPDDLVSFMEAKEYNLLSDMVELGMKHARICDAFNTYSQQRLELKDHMPQNSVSGPVVSSSLTEQDRLRLAPRFLELDSLLTSIEKLLPEYIEKARSVTNRIGPAARKYLNDPNFPLLREVDAR